MTVPTGIDCVAKIPRLFFPKSSELKARPRTSHLSLDINNMRRGYVLLSIPVNRSRDLKQVPEIVPQQTRYNRHHANGTGRQMKTISLREIAHARSGDKGDTSNVGVIAYDEA